MTIIRCMGKITPYDLFCKACVEDDRQREWSCYEPIEYKPIKNELDERYSCDEFRERREV